MIIIENPKKDTYVTDIQTVSNNGLNSNVGQSSSIDLFKIAGENKKTFARGILNISGILLDGDTFTVIDSSGVSKTYEFDNDASVDNNNILISIGVNTVETLSNVITEINSDANFGITAMKLYDDKILFKQNKPGSSGDTQIVTSGLNLSSKGFTRFEHSAGLITFDISKIKKSHISDGNIANSVFRDIENPKFSAEIRLIDVGQSSTRAKDFSLNLNVLENDFREGLGKDVVHFSDLDDANFKILNSSSNTSWTNEGIVSGDDLFIRTDSTFESFDVESGKENLSFNVTDYVHEFFKGTPNFDKESFVIHFDLDNLFDENTYFVKRFGSRNLKNKSLIPQLIIKIDDNEIESVITDKKRYFDNEEDFYLMNAKGNSLKSFTVGFDVSLRFSFIGDDNENIFAETQSITGQSIYNYKGEEVLGIKKFSLTSSVISQIQSDSIFNAKLNKLGYIPVELEYYYDNNLGTTSTIKKENINFNLSEVDQSEISFDNRNIRVSLDILQSELKADNTFVSIKLSFIDTNKQYKAVNVPTKLYSENLGKVTYEMYDVDTGEKIISDEDLYTMLKFNGKHYILNIFASDNFKNKRVNFIFKYTDPLTGLYKKASNDNTILRFI
jgi:hypothetical protein